MPLASHVACPHCPTNSWPVTIHCPLCAGSKIVPSALAVEYALVDPIENTTHSRHDPTFTFTLTKAVADMRERHGLPNQEWP